jgi:Mrp family chromosome partitioning ATPase/uncharacterized protein involved in exopolysaccharide biosynthesis
VAAVPVGRILAAVRRHVFLMVVVTSFTTAFAFIAFRQPALYRATAVLRLVGERRAVAAGIEQNVVVDDRHVIPVNSLVPRIRSRTVIGAVVDSLGLQLRRVPIFSWIRPPVVPSIELDAVRTDPAATADTIMLLFSPDSLTVLHDSVLQNKEYGEPIVAGAAQFTVPKPPKGPGAVLALESRDLAIDRVLAQLAVVPLTGTDALEVRSIDTDPRLAKAIANQVARTFYAFTISSSQEQARRRRVFLETQLEEADRQLAQAQAGVTGFRSRRRLASSSDKLARQQADLMNLDARRGELEADRRVFGSLLARLSAADDSTRTDGLYNLMYSPEVATDPIVGKVLQQLLTYDTRLDSLTTGPYQSSATNPDVLGLQRMVKSAEAELVRAVRGRVVSIEERMAALKDLRSKNAEELAALPILEAEEARLGQKAAALVDFSGGLRLEYQKARMSEELAAADVEIVDLATLPYLPTGVPWWIKVALALVAGLVAGTALSMLLEMRNRSFRAPEELEEVLHLRGLGIIPPVAEAIAAQEAQALNAPGGSLANHSGAVSPGVVADSPVFPSVGAEAFRLLYSSLTYGWGDQQRTILVTSVAPQEGKTLVAANLAVTFAREGARVLLIDCDLRRPCLHKLFQVTRKPGLAELFLPASSEDQVEEPENGRRPIEHAYSMLPEVARRSDSATAGPADDPESPANGNGSPRATLSQVGDHRSARFRHLRETGTRGLWLLPCGGVERNGAGTLKATTFRNLLSEFASDFDVILLDTAPALVSADAVVLAPIADDVLLVIRAGQTNRHAAEHVHHQLTDAGGHVVGAVLNDPDGKVILDHQYYAYGYPATSD